MIKNNSLVWYFALLMAFLFAAAMLAQLFMVIYAKAHPSELSCQGLTCTLKDIAEQPCYMYGKPLDCGALVNYSNRTFK